jgi:protein gp37
MSMIGNRQGAKGAWWKDVIGNGDPFQPVFWGNRLDQPYKVKKPAKIFVCSMADLFGDWVPQDWIESVLQIVRGCPWHTFQFLTKNPKRLSFWNPWPDNCWVGTTVTNQEDMHRVMEMWNVLSKVRFISYEPLLGPIDIGLSGAYIDWAIIGAMTGPGAAKVDPAWVQGLVDQYRAAGVPVFLKDNLYREPMGWTKKIQEFPV